MPKKPVLLMILDGFGLDNPGDGNAIALANTPNYDEYVKKYPMTTVGASGLDVGLPEGQMGNSEVGHLNIGAGRVIYQALTKITKEIKEEKFFENKAINGAFDNSIEKNSSVHLLGLLSDGGVHSHIEHVKGLILGAKKKGVTKLYLHAFLDGRDVAPKSAINYIEEIEAYMREVGLGEIASVSGRYYAMDRDKRWERVNLAYNALVLGEGEKFNTAVEAVEQSYHDNKTDEFVLPSIMMSGDRPLAKIKDGDSVIFFNFRPDRAREITRAINDVEFSGFERQRLNLYYVCMTQYDSTIENVQIAYLPESYENTLGEYISKKGLKQLRIAETEKYAHVTFFFNSGVEEPNKNEERVLINSPKVATYDLQPEMSAAEVTDALLAELEKDKFDVIVLNYANPDMVGHTGIIEAAIKAVETVDTEIKKVIDKVLEKDGSVFMTADHGNAETMIEYSTGKPMTAHTTHEVPFLYISNNKKELREGGILADIAPTMLQELSLEIPEEMTGKSLFK